MSSTNRGLCKNCGRIKDDLLPVFIEGQTSVGKCEYWCKECLIDKNWRKCSEYLRLVEEDQQNPIVYMSNSHPFGPIQESFKEKLLNFYLLISK